MALSNVYNKTGKSFKRQLCGQCGMGDCGSAFDGCTSSRDLIFKRKLGRRKEEKRRTGDNAKGKK